MLIHLEPSGLGHRRLLILGLSLAAAASLLPKEGFATEAASLAKTSGNTASNSELDKEDVKGKDHAKVEVKDAEAPVKVDAKIDAKDNAKVEAKDAEAPVKVDPKVDSKVDPKVDAKDNAKSDDKADAAGQPAEAVRQEKGKGEDDIDFTSTAPVDPIPALGQGDDDFQDLDKRAAQYAKEGAVESEDARVERELKVYKEAEAKAEREKAEQESIAREAARVNAREEAEKSAKTNKKTETEAEAKARELQGIDKDELGWKGLED
jgi:hypothetical protein